jgi:hypothetical protein
MDWWGWLEWPGWAGVAAIAAVLALAAVALALLGVYQRWQRIPPVDFAFEVYGTVGLPEGTFHLCRMYNTGRASARLVTLTFVDGRPFEREGYKFRAVMGPGEFVDFLITAERIERTYARILYRSSENRTLATETWYPLAEAGSLVDVWMADFDRGRTPWRDRIKLQVVRPVGPGYFVSARWKPTRHRSALPIVMQGIAGRALYPTSIVATRVPPDLPVVHF